MLRNLTVLCALSLAMCAWPAASAAQGDRPSPPAKAGCKFADGKTIHVDYSSPRVRGRKIFGDLVPYGTEWRTGANEATTFVITSEVTIDGKTVPAGNYTLFTLPKPDSWMLIISKQTGEWGIPYPGADSDFGRYAMKPPSKLSAPLENMTISFDPSGSTCTLNVEWETTKASVPINEKK